MKKVLGLGLLVGVITLIIGFVFNSGFNFLFPELAEMYENGDMFRPWEDPLMSLFFLHPFIVGIAYAWLWDKTKSLFKSKDVLGRTLRIVAIMFFVTILPGMLITYSSFQISLLLICSWTLGSLTNTFAAALILTSLNK